MLLKMKATTEPNAYCVKRVDSAVRVNRAHRGCFATRAARAERVAKHPLWARFTRTALSTRFTKYALGSVVAFILSNMAFALFYVMNASTTVDSVAGFVAGAIPN